MSHRTKTPKEFADIYPAKILIVEDDCLSQIWATKMLNKLGYIPAIVGNGEEALTKLQENDYDIILMDALMPRLDGYETTRIIRSCNAFQPVIIAMSASAYFVDEEKCLKAGMNDYLRKPLIEDVLLDKLIQWHPHNAVMYA